MRTIKKLCLACIYVELCFLEHRVSSLIRLRLLILTSGVGVCFGGGVVDGGTGTHNGMFNVSEAPSEAASLTFQCGGEVSGLVTQHAPCCRTRSTTPVLPFHIVDDTKEKTN